MVFFTLGTMWSCQLPFLKHSSHTVYDGLKLCPRTYYRHFNFTMAKQNWEKNMSTWASRRKEKFLYYLNGCTLLLSSSQIFMGKVFIFNFTILLFFGKTHLRTVTRKCSKHSCEILRVSSITLRRLLICLGPPGTPKMKMINLTCTFGIVISWASEVTVSVLEYYHSV